MNPHLRFQGLNTYCELAFSVYIGIIKIFTQFLSLKIDPSQA